MGKDAGLVAFAPEESFTVGGSGTATRVTPYAGLQLRGVSAVRGCAAGLRTATRAGSCWSAAPDRRAGVRE